jgi:hypothetical protein
MINTLLGPWTEINLYILFFHDTSDNKHRAKISRHVDCTASTNYAMQSNPSVVWFKAVTKHVLKVSVETHSESFRSLISFCFIMMLFKGDKYAKLFQMSGMSGLATLNVMSAYIIR